MIDINTPKFVRMLLMYGFVDYEEYRRILEEKTDDPQILSELRYMVAKYLPYIKELSDSLDDSYDEFYESPYYKYRNARDAAVEDLAKARDEIKKMTEKNTILLAEIGRMDKEMGELKKSKKKK